MQGVFAEPVRQKKRELGTGERNKAIQVVVEKLVIAGIMIRSHYHLVGLSRIRVQWSHKSSLMELARDYVCGTIQRFSLTTTMPGSQRIVNSELPLSNRLEVESLCGTFRQALNRSKGGTCEELRITDILALQQKNALSPPGIDDVIREAGTYASSKRINIMILQAHNSHRNNMLLQPIKRQMLSMFGQFRGDRMLEIMKFDSKKEDVFSDELMEEAMDEYSCSQSELFTTDGFVMLTRGKAVSNKTSRQPSKEVRCGITSRSADLVLPGENLFMRTRLGNEVRNDASQLSDGGKLGTTMARDHTKVILNEFAWKGSLQTQRPQRKWTCRGRGTIVYINCEESMHAKEP
ncbi:hypothetical protein Tco_0672543 [Tanacetum coccineum]